MKNFNITKYVRTECKNFEPYVAGKPVETIKRELGLKKVIKLASNENPLGPSKKAKEAVNKAAEKMYFYPDSNSFNFSSAVAQKFGVKRENVIFGSGSDELIEIIAKTFFNKGDEIVVSEHAFIRYKMAGDLLGCKVVSVPMKGFTHDLKKMAEAITSKTKAIFVANPNNPTGTYNTVKEVEGFLVAVKKKRGDSPPLVVFDEAYYEYASVNKDYPQTLRYLNKYPNLIILRTFSKIYGLAGLRAGYGFASENVVDYINRVRPPFNVSLTAQEAAVASLGDKNQVIKTLVLVGKEKKYFYSEFRKLGIKYVPSAANFILFESKPLLGKELFKKLLLEGIIVRAMDEYQYPYHVRVTIGLPNENKIFFKVLNKVRVHSSY